MNTIRGFMGTNKIEEGEFENNTPFQDFPAAEAMGSAKILEFYVGIDKSRRCLCCTGR